LIGKAGSVEYANKQINEFKDISKNALNLMPIENYYKELLKAYCDYLVNE
jgi:geranylgeranyl pyrophosphate synthase